MTRGFEHRLWGYRVVKIKKPDVKRGIGSESTSSALPPSPTASHDGQQTREHSKLAVVDSSTEGDTIFQTGQSDQTKGDYGESEGEDIAVRSVQERREADEEIEECRRVDARRLL